MSSLSSGQKKNHGQQPVVAQSMDQERLLMHKYAEKFRLSVRDYFVKENSKKLSKKFDKNASEFLKQSKAFSGSMAAGSALKLKLNLNRYTYADFVSFLEKFATSWESRTYKPWWWKSSQQHKLHSIIRDLIEKMKSEHSLYSADLSKQKEKAEQALRAAELEAVKAKEAAASEKAQREIAEAQVREQAVLLQSYGNLSQAVPTLLSFVDPRHASVQLLNEQQKNVAALTAAAQILHGAHGAANLAILNAQSHNAAACASIAFHQTTALACKASEILDAMVVREVAVREGERARGIQNQQTFLEANRRSLSDAVSKLNAQIKIYKDRVEGQLFSRIRKGHKKLELLLAFSQKITEIEAELAGKNPIPCKGPFDAKKAIKDAWTALSNAAQEKKFNKQGFLERTMELQAIMTTLDTVIPLPPVEISPTLTEGEVAQIRQELKPIADMILVNPGLDAALLHINKGNQSLQQGTEAMADAGTKMDEIVAGLCAKVKGQTDLMGHTRPSEEPTVVHIQTGQATLPSSHLNAALAIANSTPVPQIMDSVHPKPEPRLVRRVGHGQGALPFNRAATSKAIRVAPYHQSLVPVHQ